MVLGRAEPTLSLPELQEQVCLQAHETKEEETQKTKCKVLQIPPFPSDPGRNMQFQAIVLGQHHRKKEQLVGKGDLF